MRDFIWMSPLISPGVGFCTLGHNIDLEYSSFIILIITSKVLFGPRLDAVLFLKSFPVRCDTREQIQVWFLQLFLNTKEFPICLSTFYIVTDFSVFSQNAADSFALILWQLKINVSFK